MPTIQAAINAAQPAGGDTIEVAPGTYSVEHGGGVPITIDRQVILLGPKPMSIRGPARAAGRRGRQPSTVGGTARVSYK